MALLPTISELTLVGVADRGVPNKERVVLRPTENIKLGEFAIIAVQNRGDGFVLPLLDSFMWLGDLEIGPPSWLYIYTGQGAPIVSKISGTNQPVYVYHWGKKRVLFDSDAIQPALIRLSGIGFGGMGQTTAPVTEAEMQELWRALFAAKSPTTPAAILPTPPSPSPAGPKPASPFRPAPAINPFRPKK